jgi:hypothetical protein
VFGGRNGRHQGSAGHLGNSRAREPGKQSAHLGFECRVKDSVRFVRGV